ncbi:MAG: hypothetical protein WD696_08085 [Bryobacteraceae bacterium]
MIRTLPLLLLGLIPSTGFAGAVITNGNTSLGVNDHGHLNFFGNGPGGPLTYGVYRAGVGDAISPGCACEGWGVAVTLPGGTRTSGFVNRSSGDGGVGGGVFGSTSTTATSTTSLTGAPVTVEHRYGPSLAADVFQAEVRVTNFGPDPLTDLTYRRVMDWDVTPTPFSEFVTHQGVVANLVANGGNVLFASDNGFATSNPLLPGGSILPASINTDFIDLGPADHGSVFDFGFGTLDPGATRIFNIFYGSSGSEGGALGALAALGVDLYSLGQNSGPGGATAGTPATFLFAFGGVGGVEPGITPSVPILPFVPAPGTFEFPEPIPRRWYDPPFVDSFVYALDAGSLFTEVGLPPATFPYGPVDIIVPGFGVVAADLAMGSSFLFTGFPGGGVPTFTISGISPLIDSADPDFTTAFPTFLDFTGSPSLLSMDAVFVSSPAVPEPGSLGLAAAGVLLLAAVHRFRRRRV